MPAWSRLASLPATMVAALVVGCVLRLTGLGVHSLWLDEAMTVYLATCPDFLAELKRDHNAPLAFVLYRAWIALFGQSDEVLRLLPACVSCATLAVAVAMLPRLLAPSVAAAAAWILACSPFSIWYGQEVRGYCLVEFACTLHGLGTLWLADASRRPHLGRLLVLLGPLVALGGSYAAYPVVLQALAAAAVLRHHRIGRPWSLLGWTAAGARPWAPWFLLVVPEQLQSDWFFPPAPPLRAILELPLRLILIEPDALAGSLAWVPWTSAALLAAGLGLAAIATVRRRTPTLLLLCCLGIVPFLAALLVALLGRPLFFPRYHIVAEFGIVAMVAAGLATLPRAARTLALALLVLGLLALSVAHKQQNLRDDFRSACAEVRANWRPGDHVATLTGVFEGFAEASLLHYCRDEAELLASLVPENQLRDGQLPAGRIHVVFREARWTWPLHRTLAQRARLVHEGTMRYRVQYLRFEVP